jgi:hypothetical protein
MRHLAIAILVLAASVPLVRGQNGDAVNSPSITIFENRYKVVDRITFTDPIPFKAPAVVHGGVPLGQPSGFVGCNGKAASLPEPPARTFERVPGENSPSLFAAVVKVRVAGSPDEGIIEVALLNPCGGWIAVPIADTRDSGDYSAVGHNRVSLEFSVSTKGKGTLLSSGLVLAGAAENEDTYRVLGLAEAIVLEIPFKDLTTLRVVVKDGAASTQNLDMDAQYRAWVGDSDHPRMLEYPVAVNPRPIPVENWH